MDSRQQFHSRYNPVLEAERYLVSMLGAKRPAIFFIIGGGINYLSLAVSKLFPGAMRVSLQPCDDFAGSEVDHPDFSWHPSCGKSMNSVIADALSKGHQAGGVSVIEWPAVVSHFPVESEEIRKTIRNALESTSSGLATNAFWARRWLRNSIRFVTAASRFVTVTPGNSKIVIACAGPSLSGEMETILACEKDISLWSLASAVPALRARKLEPELIISTDPGFWNGEHIRSARESTCPIALPPSSYAQISLLKNFPIIPLDTDLLFETAAIRALGLVSIKASAAGSSLGTALSLALSMTFGPVIVAGYDLAAQGIDDHARPYPFDILEEIAASRLKPALTIRSSRVYENFLPCAGAWRLSRAFSAYASSIIVPGHDQYRVRRLGGSPVETGLPRGNLDCLETTVGEPPQFKINNDFQNQDSLFRLHAVKTMLDELVSQSLLDAEEAIRAGNPMNHDTILVFNALAGKESAAFLAEAARGKARIALLPDIESKLRRSAQEMMRIY